MSERPSVPEVSVVVVSWNTRDLLERCLASALASVPPRALELIVIDNASGDGSPEMVAARFPAARLVRNPDNRGYAPACNQGLRSASGRFVMALNSDAFLAPGALDALVRRMEADPGLAAVGPRLRNADGTTQWSCARRAPNWLTTMAVHSHLPTYVPPLRGWAGRALPADWYDAPREAEVLSGACMLFRREAFARVGYLDDALVLNYDDVEWCLRARRAGQRVGYEPAAEVVHLGGQSRAFDPESTTGANLDSIAVFWDLAFPGPAAWLLKTSLLVSLALSMVKNAVLAGSPARRRRLVHLWSLAGRVTDLMAHPLRRGREARA